MKRIIITIINPFTGEPVARDITDLTKAQIDAYAQVMNDDIREAIHSDLAPCSPATFLAAYIKRVGADAGGILILGS